MTTKPAEPSATAIRFPDAETPCALPGVGICAIKVGANPLKTLKSETPDCDAATATTLFRDVISTALPLVGAAPITPVTTASPLFGSAPCCTSAPSETPSP